MKEYPQILVNLPVREKPPLKDVPEIMTAIKASEEAFGENGRTLVHYSGTEKKLRVLVEAKDPALAKSQSDAILAAVKNTIGS